MDGPLQGNQSSLVPEQLGGVGVWPASAQQGTGPADLPLATFQLVVVFRRAREGHLSLFGESSRNG